MNNKKPISVDAYIATFPEEVQEKLELIRAIIMKAAPKAEEYIGYQMPAYKLNGSLVYFAGYKKHIGLYPHASGIQAFEDELEDYNYSKGAIQFPLDKPLPKALITKIVKYRVKENLSKK